MKTIESIVREIRRDLTPVFEQKLRAYLMDQDKEWLIEQIVRLTLDAHSLQEMDRKVMQELKARQREARRSGISTFSAWPVRRMPAVTVSPQRCSAMICRRAFSESTGTLSRLTSTSPTRSPARSATERPLTWMICVGSLPSVPIKDRPRAG